MEFSFYSREESRINSNRNRFNGNPQDEIRRRLQTRSLLMNYDYIDSLEKDVLNIKLKGTKSYFNQPLIDESIKTSINEDNYSLIHPHLLPIETSLITILLNIT